MAVRLTKAEQCDRVRDMESDAEMYVPGMFIVLTGDPSLRADRWVHHFLYHSGVYNETTMQNAFLWLVLAREWRRLLSEACA